MQSNDAPHTIAFTEYLVDAELSGSSLTLMVSNWVKPSMRSIRPVNDWASTRCFDVVTKGMIETDYLVRGGMVAVLDVLCECPGGVLHVCKPTNLLEEMRKT